jgi:hypothetical protein
MDQAEATVIIGKFNATLRLVWGCNENIFAAAFNSVTQATENKTFKQIKSDWLKVLQECATNAQSYQKLDEIRTHMEDALSLLNSKVYHTFESHSLRPDI